MRIENSVLMVTVVLAKLEAAKALEMFYGSKEAK